MTKKERELPLMHEVREPQSVEIDISSDGKVLWVNIDHVCYLRVTGAKDIKYPSVTSRRRNFLDGR